MNINKIVENLECCPFCGQSAVIATHCGMNWDGKMDKCVNIGAMYGLWYVGCPAGIYEVEVKICEVSPAACWFKDLEEAVKVWNKRAKEK